MLQHVEEKARPHRAVLVAVVVFLHELYEREGGEVDLIEGEILVFMDALERRSGGVVREIDGAVVVHLSLEIIVGGRVQTECGLTAARGEVVELDEESLFDLLIGELG